MGYSFLIVDDSKTVRAVMRRTLSMTGIVADAIFDAENGQEALLILGENEVDIVLTDVHMPVMGGVELLERMMQDDRLARVARIVITSDSTAERHAQLKGLGAHIILTKPFQPENIRDAVLSAVEGASDE